MPRIVVTEPIHEDGLSLLRERHGGDVQSFETTATKAEVAEAIAGAEAVLVRTVPLPAEILIRADRLKMVSKHGVGCDNIAVDHLTERGLPVAISADANAISVAEHTLMLMLACSRRLIEQDREARTVDWSYRQRVRAFELSGKTVLVIGMGRIGQRVARLCEAFGMRAIGFDPYAVAGSETAAVELDEGLAAADFVTLHVPLSESSAGMLDARRIGQMKSGAVLINCARGGIVDEPGLIAALDGGRIALYGTDVFETEPAQASDPLLARSDVIATLHTAAMTAEAKRAMAVQAAENVLAGLDGSLDPAVLINRKELGL